MKQNWTVLSGMHKRRIHCLLSGKAIALVVGSALVVANSAAANDFTAEKVMNEMTVEQRAAYVVGVVEGLAVARYMKDGKRQDGMKCIYDWFYEDEQTLRAIYDAFDRYGSYTPGAVMDVLAKQRCGE